MKHRLLAGLCAGVSMLSVSAFADDFALEPAISKVVVYRDGGATVTRTGTVRLPAGRHTISIDKLTRALDESQLTFGFDQADIRLYTMDTDTSYSVTPASERQAAIKASLEVLEEKDKALMADQQARDMQLAFLRTLNQKSAANDSGLPFADWQKALTFIGEQSGTILKDIEALQKERRSLAEERQKLQRELANTGPKRQDYTKATFEVMVPSARDVAYDLSYFVYGARWSLDLEGALDTQAKSLSLLSKAVISQNSGEDWKDVSIALSNNVPSDELGEIDQDPIILSLRDPDAELKAARQEAGARRVREPSQAGFFEEDVAVEEVVVTGSRVTASSTAFDRMYTVNGTVSIPSTGEEEFVDLSGTKSDARLVVRANPSDDDQAYLFVDTELKDFESLRDVEPTLRRDGHYVGKGDWPDLEANTPLKLPYGADGAINIGYIEQAPDEGDSGLFGSKKVEEKRYLITVTNNHAEAMTVEIFDQVPVSGHEDIKVKTLSDATKPTETDMDGKQGLMMWRKELAPGEVWQIKHQYRVTYPSDMRLVER